MSKPLRFKGKRALVLCENCDASPICGLSADAAAYADSLADDWLSNVVISFDCPVGHVEIERSSEYEVEPEDGK